MTRLSQLDKIRLDEAVLLASERLYADPRPLEYLHISRPNKFAHNVHRYIVGSWDVRAMIGALPMTHKDWAKEIEASVRRLYRRGVLRKEKFKVPVLLRSGRVGKKCVVRRMMTCYWPATVLDRLARC